MSFYNKEKNNSLFDIVVVGAGPIGTAFACGFADTKIKIAIIEKLPKEVIANPIFGTLYEEGDEIPDHKKVGDVKFDANVLPKSQKFWGLRLVETKKFESSRAAGCQSFSSVLPLMLKNNAKRN